MQFEYDEENDITKILAEKGEDICVECNIREVCPLMCAIAAHIVYPSACRLILENCNFYQMMEEEVETVEEDNNNEEDEET